MLLMGPTKDRKGLKPPKRTEKNIWAPKKDFYMSFYAIKMYAYNT